MTFYTQNTFLLINGLTKRFQNVSSNITKIFVQNRLRHRKSLFVPLVAPSGVNFLYTAPQTNHVADKIESPELLSFWPDVVKDLTHVGPNSNLTKVMKWFEKVMDYNVPKGKLIRGSIAVYSYKQLIPTDQLTDENIRLMAILGWCLEIFVTFSMILDDIVDNSITRRGQPCWYLRNDLGFLSINDALFLLDGVNQLLRKHFGEKPCYVDLVHVFQDTFNKTMMGYSLELMTTNFRKKPNLSLSIMDRYNILANYKTSYISFILPVLVAMHFAEIKDPEKFRQAENILLEIGNFFQVQDDYLDCYGDSKLTGKIGLDIEEGQCTWFLVVALQRVTPAQRQVLEECYGKHDPEKVARVKQLYNDLDLESAYYEYEKETYNSIKKHIHEISCGLPHGLFFNILETIYCRKK